MKSSSESTACKYCGRQIPGERSNVCITCSRKTVRVKTLLALRYTGAKRKNVRLCGEAKCVWRDAQGFCPGKGCLKKMTGI